MNKAHAFVLSTVLTMSLSSCSFSTVQVVLDLNRVSGEIMIPKRDHKVPAVILISGSGPNDKDATVNKIKPFRDLAHGLSQEGIATIRYNKVSQEYPLTTSLNFDFTPEDEFVVDAIDAYNVLINDDRIDSNRIYLLGHSQGAQFVPIIKNKLPEVKGMIFLAGTTMHILELLMNQLKLYSGEEVYQANLPLYQKTRAISSIDKSNYQKAYFGAYATYWSVYNKLLFEEELLQATTTTKTLILHGENDLQVDVSHFDHYKSLLQYNELVQFKLYDKLNHLFVEGGEDETFGNLYQNKASVRFDVIEDIANFII